MIDQMPPSEHPPLRVVDPTKAEGLGRVAALLARAVRRLAAASSGEAG